MLRRLVIIWFAIVLAACGSEERGDKFAQKKGQGTATGSDTDQEATDGDEDDDNDDGDDKPSSEGGGAGGQDRGGGGAPGTASGTSTATAVDDADADDPQPDDDGKVVDTGQAGPLKVASYTQGLEASDYESAVVYYPTDPPRAKMPATTLSGGFTNTKEDMLWLAEHLASHGFIVIAFTPTNNRVLDPNVWATGHKGAIAKIKAENGRSGSPVAGKVDVAHLGISGFSMGGAGTIVAVNELNTGVQAAAPICAFRPVQPTAKVPTLFVTGTADSIAVPGNVVNAYNSMSSGAPKALTNFARMTHFDVYQPSDQHRNIARYITAWYQVHLMGKKSYRTYFEGEELQKDKSAGVFAGASDFQFAE